MNPYTHEWTSRGLTPEPSDDLLAIIGKARTLAATERDRLSNRAADLNITETAYRDLLDAVTEVDAVDLADLLARFGLTVESFAERLVSLFDAAESFGYLAADESLYSAPDAPFDPTWSRPRLSTANGTEVRGRRDGYVVSSSSPIGSKSSAPHPVDRSEPLRLTYREAFDRAQLWHLMATGETLPMIGTDEFSWADVVAHKPYALSTVDGTTFYLRPEGAGASIAGGSNRRGQVVLPRPSYNGTATVPTVGKNGKVRAQMVKLRDPRPEVTYVNGHFPMIDVRIIKRYRTTYRGRFIVGHGSWNDTSTTVRKARATGLTRKRVPTVDVERFDVDAITAIASNMAAAYRDGKAATVKVRDIAGTMVTMSNDPANRRFRVIVTVDGARRMTTVRTLAAAITAIGTEVDAAAIIAAL
jgi:hypothetical protein